MANDTILIMRFPSEVKAALQRAAKVERRSMSNLALGILAAWLEDQRYLARKTPRAKRRAARG